MKHSNGHLLIHWAAAGFVVWTAQTASAAIWSPAPQRPAFAVAGTPPVSLSATGVIEVDAAAPGAILRIDGRPMGSAMGFRRALSAGDHEIEISAPGYKAIRQTVRVAGGGTVRLRPQLVRLPEATPAASGTDAGGFSPLPDILRTTRGLPTPGAGSHRASGAPATVPAAFPHPAQKPSAPPADASASASPAASQPAAPIPDRTAGEPDRRPPSAPAAPDLAEAQASVTSSFSRVEEELKKLVVGNVAFDAPDRMERSKPRVIEARLAVNIPPEVLMQQLTGNGRKESASLLVGDRMIGTLSGDGFDVSPSGPQRQFISSRREAVWTWEVTPKREGKQYLILCFEVALTVDGKEGNSTIISRTQTIEVDVDWPDRLKDRLLWLKSVVEIPLWLWTTILAPTGVWIWLRTRRRRSMAPRKLRRARDRRLGRDRAMPAAALSPNGPVEGSPLPQAAERSAECANARRPGRPAASAAA